MIKNFKGFLNESSPQLTPQLTPQQIEWCNKHIKGEWKVNEKGEVYTPSGNVNFKEKNFTRFEVQFADTQEDFWCHNCPQLTSLQGAPSSVGGDFNCYNCPRLETLEGAPSSVGRGFFCSNCPRLESLEGAPTSVGGGFWCDNSPRLKSLEGAPVSVGGNFGCHYSPRLKTLEGAPTSVGGDFRCDYCPQLDPREVDLVENHPELFRLWLKLKTPPIEEFLDPQGKYRGALQGKKYGI